MGGGLQFTSDIELGRRVTLRDTVRDRTRGRGAGDHERNAGRITREWWVGTGASNVGKP